MNRQDRRKQELKRPSEMTNAEIAAIAKEINAKRQASMERYGITQKDVDDARRAGYNEGFAQGRVKGLSEGIKRRIADHIDQGIMEKAYAAIALELRDRDYSSKRIINFLRGVNHRIVYALDDLELCEQVLEKCGISFRMKDPMEQVHDSEKGMSIRKFRDWSKVRKSKLLHHFKP